MRWADAKHPSDSEEEQEDEKVGPGGQLKSGLMLPGDGQCKIPQYKKKHLISI